MLTPKQQEVFDLKQQGMSVAEIAVKLNINPSSVTRRWQGAINRSVTQKMSPGFEIDRKTEGRWYEDPETGERRVEYLKSKRTKETTTGMADAFRASISDIKPLKNIKIPKTSMKDSMVVYPMGDPHIGLYAYHKEVGEDFDCDIAERDLLAAVDYLFSVAPPTDEALVVNLGDFFHSDSGRNATTKGTPVDVDTRWSRVLLIGIKVQIRMIELALGNHKRVTAIIAPGNHDAESSILLTIALQLYFENNKRVTIQEPNMFHFYEFGANLIGVCHGHTVKKKTYHS